MAKQSTTATRLANVARGARLARAAKVANSAYDTVSAPSRYVQQRIASGAVRGASLGADAAKRVYARAPSVGSTMRVRYHLARADVDVDTLDAAQQRRLGELASAADPAAAKALRRMDEDAIEDLTRLDADTRRGLAPKYADLDATERERLTGLISENRDAADIASRLDSDTLGDVLPSTCSRPSSVTALRPAGLHSDRYYSVESIGQLSLDGCSFYDLVSNWDSYSNEQRRAAVSLLEDADGGVEFLGAISNSRALLSLDVDGVDMRTWRANLARIHRSTDVTPGSSVDVTTADVDEYLDDLTTINLQRKADGRDLEVENVEGLYDEIADNPDPSQFVGQQLEAKRVARYTRDSDVETIEVEPEKNIDLRVVRESHTEYVEAKNAAGEIDKRWIGGKISTANEDWSESGIDFEETDGKVLTLGSQRGIDQNGLPDGSSTDDSLRTAVQREFHDRFDSSDDIEIDTVRIIKSDGSKVEVDVSQIDV